MIKKIFFYALLCSTSLTLEAQNKVSAYLELDTILFFPEHVLSPYRKSICTYYKDKVYLVKHKIRDNKDTIPFLIVNLKTYERIYDTVIVPGLSNILLERYNMSLSEISVFDNTILLSGGDDLLCFKIHQDGKIYYEKKFRLPFSARKIKLIDERHAVAGDIYYGWDTSTCLALVNIETEETEHFVIPGNYHTVFSFLNTSKLIDISPQFVVMADRNRYAFRIYDTKTLECIEQENRVLPEWKNFNTKKIDKLVKKYDKTEAMTFIHETSPFLYKMHQIKSVNIISPTKLLLAYQEAILDDSEIPNVIVDIWEKRDQKWILTEKNKLYDFIRIEEIDGKISKNSFGFAFLSGSELFFDGQQVVVLSSRFSGADCYPIGKTIKEYGKCQMEFYENNEPFLEVSVFKHSF